MSSPNPPGLEPPEHPSPDAVPSSARDEPVFQPPPEPPNTVTNTRLGLRVHPTVFLGAAGVIVPFAVLSLVFLKQMSRIFAVTQETMSANAGWFYVLCMNAFLVFALYLLFSRYGSIRIGGDDARPEFT